MSVKPVAIQEKEHSEFIRQFIRERLWQVVPAVIHDRPDNVWPSSLSNVLCPGRQSSQLSNQRYFIRRLTFLCHEPRFSGWNVPPTR
ncbi:hypothetical protein ACR8UD_005219, partial [Escherichia coli]